jgi:hypothetical protein
MDAERLAEIREITENAPRYTLLVNGALAVVARHRKELLDYVDELTRQRDDARRLAVASGVFQDHRGEDYDLDSDTTGEPWRADPVGAVAWDKQEQQR